MKYIKLLLMGAVSFITMFVLMYVMVDSFSNVYLNLNQVYMAAIMVAPMMLLKLFFMRSMYTSRVLNTIIGSACTVAFLLLLIFVRYQTGIADREFLRSMIPHHAAAILMCEQASLQDPEIKELCDAIVTAQQEEIILMKSKLAEMGD